MSENRFKSNGCPNSAIVSVGKLKKSFKITLLVYFASLSGNVVLKYLKVF